MRIYLDNCCFNRPYDDQGSLLISLEARAKLYIQEKIRQGDYELVCSYMLEYENSQNRDIFKRDIISLYQSQFCKYYVPYERMEELQDRITNIMTYGITYKDAVHVACAIFAECDYFLTTDIRLQKRYKGMEIKIVNPLDFIRIIDGKDFHND